MANRLSCSKIIIVRNMNKTIRRRMKVLPIYYQKKHEKLILRPVKRLEKSIYAKYETRRSTSSLPSDDESTDSFVDGHALQSTDRNHLNIHTDVNGSYNALDFSDIDLLPTPPASPAANRQVDIHHNGIHQDVTQQPELDRHDATQHLDVNRQDATHNHSVNRRVNRRVNRVTQQPDLECQEPFCKRNGAFASKTTKENHKKKEHSEKCIDCGAGFATVKYLGEHVNEFHCRTIYPCKHFVIDENYICMDEKCRKSIYTKEELHYMETPSGRRPVQLSYRIELNRNTI